MPDGSTQWRWIQEVTVIRGDKPAGYRQDFGPASDFEKIQPLLIPSFGENTVAQLQHRAEKNRNSTFWYEYAEELKAESTLMRDMAAQIEEIEEVRHNRSVLGPYQNSQRNGYAVGLNRKQMKERFEERSGKKTFYGK